MTPVKAVEHEVLTMHDGAPSNGSWAGASDGVPKMRMRQVRSAMRGTSTNERVMNLAECRMIVRGRTIEG